MDVNRSWHGTFMVFYGFHGHLPWHLNMRYFIGSSTKTPWYFYGFSRDYHRTIIETKSISMRLTWDFHGTLVLSWDSHGTMVFAWNCCVPWDNIGIMRLLWGSNGTVLVVFPWYSNVTFMGLPWLWRVPMGIIWVFHGIPAGHGVCTILA